MTLTQGHTPILKVNVIMISFLVLIIFNFNFHKNMLET